MIFSSAFFRRLRLWSSSALIFLSVWLQAQTTSSTPTLSGGVYQIGTLAELLWVSENSSTTASFELTADIDALSTQHWDYNDDDGDGNRYNDTNDAVTSLGTNEGWPPIGSLDGAFKGSFNGNGYTISGININGTSDDFSGFFSQITFSCAAAFEPTRGTFCMSMSARKIQDYTHGESYRASGGPYHQH